MRQTTFHAMTPAGLVVDAVTSETTKLPVSTRVAVTSAACPECTAPSSRIPSRYRRQLFDLPSHGRCVRLTMAVHRFRRGNQVYPRRIFGEPLVAAAARG